MVRGRWLGRGQVATGSCSERLFSTRDALGPTSKEKSVCQVFSLKAATDYTSCPTDKHPASSQDTQSRPAAPEESGDLAGYDNLRLFVDNQGPLTTALAVCADV